MFEVFWPRAPLCRANGFLDRQLISGCIFFFGKVWQSDNLSYHWGKNPKSVHSSDWPSAKVVCSVSLSIFYSERLSLDSSSLQSVVPDSSRWKLWLFYFRKRCTNCTDIWSTVWIQSSAEASGISVWLIVSSRDILICSVEIQTTQIWNTKLFIYFTIIFFKISVPVNVCVLDLWFSSTTESELNHISILYCLIYLIIYYLNILI